MRVEISDWVWLPLNEYPASMLPALWDRLTIRPRRTSLHQVEDPAPIALFREDRDLIGIPRGFFVSQNRQTGRIHEIEDKTSQGREIESFFKGELKEDQKVALAAVLEDREKGSYGGIIQAVPGYGKTVTALGIWNAFRTTAVVVVQKQFLVDQWIERINQFMPGARVGRIQRSTCEYGEDFDISVAMIQTLVKRVNEYPKDLWDSFGLVISDECFAENTKIMTETGLQRIGDVRVGDAVLNSVGMGHVQSVSEREVDVDNLCLVRMSDGYETICTSEHRFFTNMGWKNACDIQGLYSAVRLGKDSLPISKGMWSRVDSVEVPKQTDFERFGIGVNGNKISVFNIGVSGHPSYVLENGSVVHNCHHVAAPSWNKVVPMFKARYRLGLSATPRRKDGAEDVFLMHLGDVVYKSKVRQVVPRLRRVFTGFIPIKTRTFDFDLVSKEVQLRHLCKSPQRNKLVVSELHKALGAGRKVMVLSERLKHLDILKEMFDRTKKEELISDFYVGGRKQAELKVAEKADVLFCTYQMAKEALDIPTLDTVFLVTPVSDVEQAVGRIMRECDDKKQPVITDFIDDNVANCVRAWNTRRVFYIKEGMFKA